MIKYLTSNCMSCLVLIAAALMLGGCGDHETQDGPQNSSIIGKRIKYGFTLENPTNKVLKGVLVSVRAPLQENGVQNVPSVDATEPYELLINEDGGRRLDFRFDELMPYSVKDVWITSDVELHLPRAGQLFGQLQRYTSDAPFVEVSSVLVKGMIAEFDASTDLERLRNAYTWINNNIKDEVYIKEDLGASVALSAGSGDCTEQMYLFMALSRAMGVPARGVAGFVQEMNGVVYAREYHNWAEVYLDGAWRVVDPQKERFLDHEQEYIAMEYLGLGEPNSEGSQKFFHASEGVNVAFR